MTNPSSRVEVRRVLIITLILNLLVAFGKIVLGLLTGALAITADGFHSLTDSAGNVAGLVANVLAERPADENHPYGHRRFETIAALLIGALLLLTAWEVFKGVLERLENPTIPAISPLSFAVLILTLFINIGVSRYQIRAGTRLQSEILLADAKNTSADVYVTLSVLLSSFFVTVFGWLWLDMLAACVVVVLIAKAAWEILSQTVSVLVDTAPYSPEQLTGLIADIPQVCAVHRARSRGTLDAAHIDIDLAILPEIRADHSEQIANAVRQRLHQHLSGIAEIEVHFLADYSQGRNAVLTARAYADAHGLSTHEVEVSHDARGTVLEMHVEVPAEQSLAEAHEQVRLLEEEVKEALSHIDRIVTHIEPIRTEQDALEDTTLVAYADSLEIHVEKLLVTEYPDVGWHEISARPIVEGFAMSLHATLPAQVSVQAAHHVAENAETFLKARLPELARVTIHTEPYDHD